MLSTASSHVREVSSHVRSECSSHKDTHPTCTSALQNWAQSSPSPQGPEELPSIQQRGSGRHGQQCLVSTGQARPTFCPSPVEAHAEAAGLRVLQGVMISGPSFLLSMWTS